MEKVGVDELACYIIEAANQISNRDLLKVASVTTNTYLRGARGVAKIMLVP